MEINWTEVLFLLGSTAVLLFIYVKWVYSYWEKNNVPYMKPTFPMGNVQPPWAIKKGHYQWLADIYLKFKSKGYAHGGIFSALRPMYVPVDLNIIKNILIKDFQHFVDRGEYYNEKDDPLSAHLFNIEGEKWRHLRARLSPTFTSGKMKAMLQLVVDCGRELENEVNKIWKSNNDMNTRELSALFTTNVIGTCAFGLDCNCFENPNNGFRVHSKKFFEGGLSRVLRQYVTLSFPEISKKLGIRVFDKATGDFFMDVMKNIINDRRTTNIKRNDFVDLLMEVNKGAKTVEDTFTFQEMAAQAFVFFLAGFETSASTMTFALYELAEDREIQNKAREEIHTVMDKYGGKLTYEALMEMTYLGQIVDETLRKYPVGNILRRICTKDYKVPGHGSVLKKGMKVMISVLGNHRDPELYPNPEKFDPVRFTPENKLKRHPCAHIPFGEGPRNCIGMRFGIMQAKIGVASVLKGYKCTISPRMPPLEFKRKSLFMIPVGGVLLNIEKV